MRKLPSGNYGVVSVEGFDTGIVCDAATELPQGVSLCFHAKDAEGNLSRMVPLGISFEGARKLIKRLEECLQQCP